MGCFFTFVIPAGGIFWKIPQLPRICGTINKERMHTFHVYIMGGLSKGLYIGVTSNLVQRVHQHRIGAAEGFTKKYNLTRLLYFEEHATADSAITREKQMKKWKRIYKERLITKMNPAWTDLWPEIV